ncbi:hypothetical protein, partial [Collimonas silvisoli]|uniref:hypothetical protein n=1 Tax=Collimonas silvisoli TaxID=2825884 RepID=UPI001B8C3A7C
MILAIDVAYSGSTALAAGILFDHHAASDCLRKLNLYFCISKKKGKIMRISFIALMLAVCPILSHAEESAVEKKDDLKSDTARIRLFGQNGMG